MTVVHPRMHMIGDGQELDSDEEVMDEGTVVSKVGGRLKQLFRCIVKAHPKPNSITENGSRCSA